MFRKNIVQIGSNKVGCQLREKWKLRFADDFAKAKGLLKLVQLRLAILCPSPLGLKSPIFVRMLFHLW